MFLKQILRQVYVYCKNITIGFYFSLVLRHKTYTIVRNKYRLKGEGEEAIGRIECTADGIDSAGN